MIIKQFTKKIPNTNLIQASKKFISCNPDIRLNIMRKRAAKQNERNKHQNYLFQKKQEIEREIEEKYSKINETFLDVLFKKFPDFEKKAEELEIPNDKNVYFVPLADSDYPLLKNFDESSQQILKEGGRIVLFHAVKHFNRIAEKEQKIKLNFIPLTPEQVIELEEQYHSVFQNEGVYTKILQEGNYVYQEIQKIRKNDTENMKTIFDYGQKFSNSFSIYDNFRMPFSSKISLDFKRIEDARYIKLLGDQMKEENLCDLFEKMYFNYFSGLQKFVNSKKGEFKFLDSIKNEIEPFLFTKTRLFAENLREKNFQFSFEKDPRVKVIPFKNIFHKVLVKGVNVDRTQNNGPRDYIYIDHNEHEGVRYFLHKHFTGNMFQYYANHEENEGFLNSSKDPNFQYKFKSEVTRKNRQLVLRAYFFIKHPYILKIQNTPYTAYSHKEEFIENEIKEFIEEGVKTESILSNPLLQEKFKKIKNSEKEQKLEKQHNYVQIDEKFNYNHLIVFENQLTPPKDHILMEGGFEKFVSEHKIDHKNWKIADVDHFLEGNSFFIDWEKEFPHDFNQMIMGDIKENSLSFSTQIKPEDFKEYNKQIANIKNHELLEINAANFPKIIQHLLLRLYVAFKDNSYLLKEMLFLDKITNEQFTIMSGKLNNDYNEAEKIIDKITLNFSEEIKDLFKIKDHDYLKFIFGEYFNTIVQLEKSPSIPNLKYQRETEPFNEKIKHIQLLLIDAQIAKDAEVLRKLNEKSVEAESEPVEKIEKEEKTAKQAKVQPKNENEWKKKFNPRIPDGIYLSNVLNELTEEELRTQSEEIINNPEETKNNPDKQRRYRENYTIQTIPKSAKPISANNNFVVPAEYDKFQERPFKNSLEEKIALALNLRMKQFMANKLGANNKL